jgi:hypothetical protein
MVINMIETTKNKLWELKRLAIRNHYRCEDCWYSCPKAPEGCCNDAEGPECNCGADDHNDKVNTLFNEILDSL